MQLTAAHWVYLAGVAAILTTMILRKNILVPAVAATFLTALVFARNLVTALSAIFNASLVAAVNLFSIFLIIALVTAMLGALQAIGADRRMVTPFRRIMRNAHVAFWVLAAVTYAVSLFFWPTPAVPLIGAVLIPVAIRAGLSPMGVGLVVAIAGQGMALSSDYIIRVAPGLSAKAAGADADVVADRAMVLSLIVGGIALALAYLNERTRVHAASESLLREWENGELEADSAVTRRQGRARVSALTGGGELDGGMVAASGEGVVTTTQPPAPRQVEPTIGHGVALRGTPAAGAAQGLDDEPVEPNRWAPLFAAVVPLAYATLVGYMVVAKVSDSVPDLKGGDAAALVGGIATVLLFFAAFAKGGRKALEASASHVVDGLAFAFKAMGVVLPIAGFFFIGNGEFAGQILGISDPDKSPSFLVDLVHAVQAHIPQSGLITGFGILLIGMVAGLEGSGFSGLPLTGSLAGSLGPLVHVEPSTLAAIGQMGNIWSGGGTLVAWSSLVAVAGFARVSVVDLARRCFLPVCAGLAVATVFAVIFF